MNCRFSDVVFALIRRLVLYKHRKRSVLQGDYANKGVFSPPIGSLVQNLLSRLISMNWAILSSFCGQLSFSYVLRLRTRFLTLEIAVHIFPLMILIGWAVWPLGILVCIAFFILH